MFHRVIEDIAKELNIKCFFLSKDWVIQLTKGNKTKFIVGYKFDVNTHGVGLVLDDKYAFYDVLNNANIPVCKYNIFYSHNNKNKYAKGCNSYKDIFKIFKLYNNDAVVKVNNGSLGTGVYHVKNKLELVRHLKRMFKKNFSISICPYYDIVNEYRVIILNNKIKLIYKKIRPIVYGNGVDTIKELLVKFNPYYFKDKKLSNKVLLKDKEYIYDWRFNLSKGSICSAKIDNSLKKKLSHLALSVVDVVGISFASVDIIELKNNKLLVLEANSGVTIDKAINFIDDGYNVAKKIYKEAIMEMFK